jgi:chromosome partitioning protein
VVCDFSPIFSSNPERIIAKLSHIVIPTTLNPLGLNTHGRVVERTVEEIRKINKTAQIHVLINNYQPLDQKNILPKKILENYRSVFEPILTKDPLFNLIDPEECAIRYSKLLFYWGGHLFTGAKPGLALSEQRNTESNPRTDFLNLLEYFEEQYALKSSIVGTLKSVR